MWNVWQVEDVVVRIKEKESGHSLIFAVVVVIVAVSMGVCDSPSRGATARNVIVTSLLSRTLHLDIPDSASCLK
jgi:hypothetical protein